MPLVDTQEVLDKLAALGPYDGAPEKQFYRTSLNGFSCLVVHPSMTTAVDADGDPVNSDPEVRVPGRRYVPKVVELPAQNIDSYIEKGFKVPTKKQLGEETEELPPATDAKLEGMNKTELKAAAAKAGVEVDERTSVTIARILAARAARAPKAKAEKPDGEETAETSPAPKDSAQPGY